MSQQKNKMKIYKVVDHHYCATIFIIIDCTQEKLAEYCRKKYDIDLDIEAVSSGRYFSCKNKKERLEHHIIWCEHFDWSILWQSLLAHEIFHLVNGIMQEVGMKSSDDSEEAYAYLFSNLFFEIWRKLAPLNPKHKKVKRAHSNPKKNRIMPSGKRR